MQQQIRRSICSFKGILHTFVSKTAVTTGTARRGAKKGTARVASFFGFMSVCDGSIGTAMKKAQLKKLKVEKEVLSILGIYAKCTILAEE